MNKAHIYKVFNRIQPFFYALAIAIILLVLVWIKWVCFDNDNKINDVLVEFHGLVFDIIVFGVILTIYEYNRERKDKIEEYKNEINDFRDWKEPEGTYRIMGAYGRLLKEGYSDVIKLSYCHFEKYNFYRYKLYHINFSKATFKSCNFYKQDINHCNFKGAKMEGVYFRDISISNCDFSNMQIKYMDFKKVIFGEKIKFKGYIGNIGFTNTDISNIDIHDCTVSNDPTDLHNPGTDEMYKDWFEQAEKLYGAKGVEKIREKYNLIPDMIEVTDQQTGFPDFKEILRIQLKDTTIS